jgi:hypothetical protein
MRGGAQAHLLECDDGYRYIVKFRNNPQHPRILVNEWIASVLLNYLQISTPIIAIVNLSPDFLAANPDIKVRLGSRCLDVEPGCHFGSQYAADPATTSLYDFVPDALLDKVVNLDEFLGVLAFDKWIGNADSRQAIFSRPRLQRSSPLYPDSPRQPGFLAHMIDQGYAFGGPQWSYYDSPPQGLYFRTAVYRGVRSLDDFQPSLDRIVNFPVAVLDTAQKQIPLEWLDGDQSTLEALLTKLMSRRKRVPDLLVASRNDRSNPFPRWQQ